MVTQIQLGNFSTVDGKNVLYDAGGSGLDTQSIINELVAARSTQSTQDQDEIKVNNSQSAALSQFQQLLTTLQSSASALRNPPGVENAADNVFDFTTGNVSANGTGYVTVSTAPGATIQNYTINNITQLASAATQTSGVFSVTSADASVVSTSPIEGTSYQFAPGTVTINGEPITLNQGDSLNTVAADFNAVSSETGIAATVVQISSNQFELQFNATQTGAANGFNLSSSSTVSDPSGVMSNIGLTEQQATGPFSVTGTSATIVSASPIAGTSNQFAPGTLTFTGGATVTLAEGDSLATVASKFNAVSSQTGIAASIIEPTSGHYELVFTATPGSASFDMTQLTTVSDPSGVLTGANVGTTKAGNAVTAGEDANFKLNGIEIDRSSNNISDVINGLTFNLLQTTSSDQSSNANIEVSIQPDTTTIQNTINNFVSAYNALQTFATQQTQLNSNGTYASSAVLATNETFRQTMNDVTEQVIAQVSGIANGNLNSLAALGITFTNQPATSTTPEVPNILTVDDGQLTSDLSSNFQQVQQLFGFSLTSNNPNLTVFSETNGLGATNFTLNIAPNSSTFTATVSGSDPVTLTATPLSDGTGYLLTGPEGSAFEGLQLIYASNSAATINVTATQGIADKVYNASNAATTANTGTIAVSLTSIQSNDTTLNNDITQVNQQISVYQQQLLQEFSALEQAVSSTNNLLDSLSEEQAAQLESAQVP